jgi:ABC-type multidrug transport system fused ATPase/permease subunit
MIKRNNYSLGAFWQDVWKFLKNYKWRYGIAMLLRVSSDLANLVPIWGLGQVVSIFAQRGFKNLPLEDFSPFLIIWIVAVTYRQLSKFLSKYIANQVAIQISYDAIFAGLLHIYQLDTAWQEKENSGNKLKRISHGGKGYEDLLKIVNSNIIESVVNIVGVIVIMLSINWEFGAAFTIFAIVYYFLSVSLSKKTAIQAKIVSQKDEDLEGIAFESLNNIRTIKALGLNKPIKSRVKHFTDLARAEVQKRVYLYQARGLYQGLLFRWFEFGIVVYVVLAIINGKYDAGILVLVVGYLGKIGAAVDEFSEVTQDLIMSKIYIGRLSDIMRVKPTIEVAHEQKDYPSDWVKLETKDLEFSYGDDDILRKINLTVNRGQRIGIVGLSGSGKSTLFGLLLDLYENFKGDILIGDTSIKDINRYDYIKHTATVLQDTELFNTTLEDNILIAGTVQIPSSEVQERLQRAIKVAHLDDVIAKLPNGAKTVVGEKGIKLSGGERQRVGIARAVFRQPDLLLLDEATSHLDVDSEKKIQESLHEFFQEVTAIVIAHRLSTIKEMDKIIVMQKGRIVETGNFEELLAQEGEFSRLWKKMQ